MRIVYIITKSAPIGGAQIHVRDLAIYLKSQGHDVHVVVGDTGLFTEQLTARGVRIHPMPSLCREISPVRDILCLWRLYQLLGEIRPDIVSTHSSKAGWLGRLASWLNRIPVLFTAHGWAFTDGVPATAKAVYLRAEKMAAPFATLILTVSENDHQLALKYAVGSPAKLLTVHNGMPAIDAAWVANPGTSPPVMVMTARFDEPKDHGLLLEALSGLKDLRWSLELIGDGSRIDFVRERVEALGLKDRVKFWGTRSDVAEILSRAQLLVLPTKWEGFPRSILEAMRAGLPVIASDVGGVREAVREGETGRLVARGDVEGWRRALCELLADGALRAEMGLQGKLLFDQSFVFEVMLEKTLAVYRQAARFKGGN